MKRIFLCALLVVLVPKVQSLAVVFTLTEHLGEPWTQERVSFPVKLPPGMDPAHLAVESAGTVLPAQFVPESPGTRAGKVFFVVDLPPRATQHWTLVSAEHTIAPDLFVTAHDRTLEVGTSRIAVRLPYGLSVPAGGAAAADFPSPILAIRQTDGSWTAAGQLGSLMRIEGFRAEILDSGPVFARVRLTYLFAGGKSYRMELEAIAGQEVILIRESADLNPQANYLQGLRPADAPQGNYTMYAYGPRLLSEGSFWTLPLPGDVHGQRASGAGPLLTLNPSHGEWWRNASWWGPVYPAQGKNYLAVLALQAGVWQNPHENVPVLEAGADGQVRLLLPINAGRRTWALYNGQRAVDAAPVEPEPYGQGDAESFPGVRFPRPAHLAAIKYGLLPLDLVKDWTLDFPDKPGVEYPHIYAQADRLPRIRRNIAETPVLQTHVSRLKMIWDEYRATNDPAYPLYKNYINYDRGLDNLYLATADDSYARDLAKILIARLRYYVHQTKAGVGLTGYRWGHGYGMFHLAFVLHMAARQADFALGSPAVSADERREIRALLAFFAELFSSRDYFAPGYNQGNTDMVMAHDHALGLIAAVLHSHPNAPQWAATCQAGVNNALTKKHHLPSVEQDEHYAMLTMSMIARSAIALKNAGLADLLADNRIRSGLEFYGRITVPFDPRNGGGYLAPYGNGQAPFDRGSMWAEVAAAVARDDPAWAARLMWFWDRTGRAAGDRPDFGWDAMGWIDPAIQPANPGLVSEVIPDWGVVFRSASGERSETFLTMQVGKPGGLNTFNAEGGLHWVAKGVPLCLLFGIRSWDADQHQGFANATRQRWLANRPDFGFASEFDQGTGKLTQWATSSHADVATAQWTFRRLEESFALQPQGEPDGLVLSKPYPWNADLQPGFTREKHVDPIIWRRHLLFVKDSDEAGYIVLRDTVATQTPWTWNIWCLAKEQHLDGHVMRFAGKLGVDLDLTPLTAGAEIVTGAYGPARSYAGDWRQLLYQVRLPAQSGDFAAVLFPRRAGVAPLAIDRWAEGAGAKITMPNQTHYVLLADQPGHFQTDGFTIIGRSAVIKIKGDQTTLALLSGSRIATDRIELATTGEDAGSVSLALAGTTLTGESRGAARELTLTGAAVQKVTSLRIDDKPDALRRGEGKCRFTLPEGEHRFELR